MKRHDSSTHATVDLESKFAFHDDGIAVVSLFGWSAYRSGRLFDVRHISSKRRAQNAAPILACAPE
jgi:hypothetical protein